METPAPTARTALDEYFAAGPPTLTGADGHDPTCSLCERLFETTPGYPTHTLLCGHRYHTMCYFIHQDSAIRSCPSTTCEFPIWDTFRNVTRRIDQERIDQVDEALEETVRSENFKKGLKGFKASIRDVTKAHKTVLDAYTMAYNQFIHRHLYTINQLQSELNTAISSVKSSDDIKAYKKSLTAYRKQERSMFRTYGVTLRELQRRRILNTSWRIRWILERHRASFSTWRYILRIKPGDKLWTDPIRENNADEV